MAFNYAPYQNPEGYDTKLSDVLGMFNSGMDRGRAQKDDADARTTLAKLAELFGQGDQQAQIPYSFEDPFASVPSQPNVGPLGTAALGVGVPKGPIGSAALGVGGADGALISGSAAATQGATDPALAAALGGRYGPQDTGGGIDSYMAQTMQRESGSNQYAANPNSSALGPAQFLESTWNGLMQQYPQLGLTADGRTDPAQNERAMRQFTQDNAKALSGAGIPVNPANLYAAHFLGPQGASEVLGLADNTPMVAAVSPEVISANPFLQNMTVGDFKQWTAGQGGSPTGGYQAPSSQGYRPQIPRELLAELLQNPQTREIGLSFLKGNLLPADALKPIEINGQLVNPLTGQVIGDYRDPNGNDETLFAPMAGHDADGNPVLIQGGNKGSLNILDLPEGVSPNGRYEKIDLGTEWLIKDLTTGLSEKIPKDVSGEAYANAFGSEAGKAAAARIDALPGMLAKADNMLSTIDGVLNDPALDWSTGWLSFLQGIPGTDQYRVGQRALQLQGDAFLQAFESLRGGGAITEIEGQKATQAIGRLSTAQKAEDYRDALAELKGIIEEAKKRAQTNAGVAPAGDPAAEATTLPDPMGIR